MRGQTNILAGKEVVVVAGNNAQVLKAEENRRFPDMHTVRQKIMMGGKVSVMI